ncbi:MAG: hypothetical protein ACMUEL_06815 [Flavobacteriales bacterium Tduv]
MNKRNPPLTQWSQSIDPMGRDRERNKKIYQKGQGMKVQPSYSGISLFKMMLLSHWYTSQ